MIYSIVSAAGFFFIPILCWLLSANRRRIAWRAVGGAFAVFVALAFVFLFFPKTTVVFTVLQRKLSVLWFDLMSGLNYLMGFGDRELVDLRSSKVKIFVAAPLFLILPRFILVSIFSAALHKLGVLPWIFRQVNKVTSIFGARGIEGGVCLSHVVLGVEGVLPARPYLSVISRSQLCAMMAVGMASANSSLAPIPVSVNGFENFSFYLATGLLSMIGAFALAKILMPEDSAKEPIDEIDKAQRVNSFDATVFAAIKDGLRMILWVASIIIAVLGLVAVIDIVLGLAGQRINVSFGQNLDGSLKGLLGYVTYPVAVLLGAPLDQGLELSRALGHKLIGQEWISVKQLILAAEAHRIDARTMVLGICALGGSVNIPTFAAFLGALCSLAPKRSREFFRIGPVAFAAAFLACLLCACFFGVLVSNPSTAAETSPM